MAKPSTKPPLATGVTQTDFTQLLYSEFRWQRRLMFLLILFLLLIVPFLFWWMQSNSLNAAVTAAKLAVPNTSKTASTTAAASGATVGTPGTNGAAGAVGRPGATGATGAPGSTGPKGDKGDSAIETASGSMTVDCNNQDCVNLQDNTPGNDQPGNINIDGTVMAGHLSGDGSLVSNVNASQLDGQSASYYTNASTISSGTLDDARLSQNVALLNSSPTFSGSVAANALHLVNAVDVPTGGTGRTSLPANQLLVGNGTSPVLALSAGSIGQCLITTNSGPGFADCPSTDLQTAYNTNAPGAPAITTTSNHPTIGLRAGTDNAQFLQVINAAGSTEFAVNSATGATTVGGSSGGAQFTVNTTSQNTVAVLLKATAGQVADLLQAKDSSGNTVARIDANGNAFFTNSTQTGLANFANLTATTIASTGQISTTANLLVGSGTPIASLQVNASPAQVGQLIKAANNQIADLLQVQDSSGNNLLRLDASGKLYVKSLVVAADLIVSGHLITSGSPPTISTLLSVLTPLISGDDSAGSLTLTTVLGVNAGTLAHVSFVTPYSAPPRVIISATTSAAANLPVYVNVTANGFDIVSASATATANVYSYNYVVIE